MAKNQLKFRGITYDLLVEGTIYLSASLLGDTLEPNTLQVTVETDSSVFMDFAINEPVTYIYNGTTIGVFYLQEVTQVAKNRYDLYGTSAIGFLLTRAHKGGIYTGETLQTIVSSICGDVPYSITTALKTIKLYGWLPYVKPPTDSARDNLAQVLFAVGATVTTDLSGTLMIGSFARTKTGDIGRNKMGLGSSLIRDAKTTGISLTEHQYVKGTEVVTLYDGRAVDGAEITFDEPVHSITSTAFTIQSSGANYAILSSGSGTVTGKKYIHNTYTVNRDVDTAQGKSNIQTINDKTLISIANSGKTANRLVNYYHSYASVDAPIVYDLQKPGQIFAVANPFGGAGLSACLKNAEIKMSNKLAANVNLLVDFTPPIPDSASESVNVRVQLSGSGTQAIPTGATRMTYILVGGGQGGKCGRTGNPGQTVNTTFQFAAPAGIGDTTWTIYYAGYRHGTGGAGGAGGDGGTGGKILTGDISVAGFTSISYSCGSGGAGASYNASNLDAAGASGGNTTITVGGSTYSSASGQSYDAGYTDVTTQTTYGSKGQSGVAGGAASGAISGQSVNVDTYLDFAPAESITDLLGHTWSGGNTPSSGTSAAGNPMLPYQSQSGVYYATGPTMGSGPAAGSNGTSGQTVALSTTAPAGIAGASASLVPAKATLGAGGRGGYGGGGGSSSGLVFKSWSSINTTGSSVQLTPSSPGAGGKGSAGGAGGDGLIILIFYN